MLKTKAFFDLLFNENHILQTKFVTAVALIGLGALLLVYVLVPSSRTTDHHYSLPNAYKWVTTIHLRSKANLLFWSSWLKDHFRDLRHYASNWWHRTWVSYHTWPPVGELQLQKQRLVGQGFEPASHLCRARTLTTTPRDEGGWVATTRAIQCVAAPIQ